MLFYYFAIIFTYLTAGILLAKHTILFFYSKDSSLLDDSHPLETGILYLLLLFAWPFFFFVMFAFGLITTIGELVKKFV